MCAVCARFLVHWHSTLESSRTTTTKCQKEKKWPSRARGQTEFPFLLLGRMNVPLSLFTFALLQLICAAVVSIAAVVITGSVEYVSLEDQLLEDGTISGSGRRTCRLYCRVGIGFHLQIHTDGRVNGSHEPNQLSVLELFAVSQGVIAIRGVYSNRFLAMNKRGRLHAIERFTDDCRFWERFQESSYNTYASVLHRNHRTGRDWYVALNKRGRSKMGSSPRVKSQHVSTHFLPRLNDLHSVRGFTITHRSKERRRNQPPLTKPPSQPYGDVNAETGKRVQTVKYWPKFRFG
ncbi:fibroblast growth factor 5-like [Salvelinus fontinalis]|uniref:fibroblast growth factor 5-like n=1 Tax=Salvelinus fontinalis TaxID=8038 RepID=UPI0024867C99|nr:fibroblast growth factor 5-like [Salvelinus fontinalis]